MNYATPELNSTEFNLYSLLLAISGILLIVTAATGFGSRTPIARGLNALFGLAFVAYAIYLQFIFDGGTVIVSYYVFVVPILLIVQAFRTRAATKQQEAQRREPGWPQSTPPGQPSQQMGYPSAQQPGYSPQQGGYAPQGGYPAQGNYPAQPQGGYPAPQGGYGAPQQPGYPTQGGYPPPPQGGARSPEVPPADPTAPRY